MMGRLAITRRTKAMTRRRIRVRRRGQRRGEGARGMWQ
jgi:hypothetical protein